VSLAKEERNHYPEAHPKNKNLHLPQKELEDHLTQKVLAFEYRKAPSTSHKSITRFVY